MRATLMVMPHGDGESWTTSLDGRPRRGLVSGYAPTGGGGYGIISLCEKSTNADLIAAVMSEKAFGKDFSSSTPRPWAYSDRDGGVIEGAGGEVVVQGMPETTARRVIAAVDKHDIQTAGLH